MARYLGPRCRLSRRERTDLGLISTNRPIETKCKFDTPPGLHGAKRGRETEHGRQLREKQKLRYMYGIMEKQFRNYFKIASRLKGSTGENLLKLLERRLDNVVYRMGFASTRAEARQMVSHRSITVNGKIVNIPSYMLSPGDGVGLTDRSKSQLRVQSALTLAQGKAPCDWLEVNTETTSGSFKNIPDRDQLPPDIKEQLIVEFYSK